VKQTVRENSVSTGFECNGWISREWLYIPNAQSWGSSLDIFESFLNILEPTISSLIHSLLRDCILMSVRAS
jgi:hypothetical protein